MSKLTTYDLNDLAVMHFNKEINDAQINDTLRFIRHFETQRTLKFNQAIKYHNRVPKYLTQIIFNGTCNNSMQIVVSITITKLPSFLDIEYEYQYCNPYSGQ
jgi:hypothetical protein